MNKNAEKMEKDCGGLKPFNPIKPPKKSDTKKPAKKATTKSK